LIKKKKTTVKKAKKTTAKKNLLFPHKTTKKKTIKKTVKKVTKKKATKKKKKVVNMKKRYANVGRKKFDGKAEDVVNKLEYAFSMGCTDKEACIYAGTNRTSLTNYQNEHPEFLDRKEQLKDTPILMARQKVIENIDQSVDTAKWFIERKVKKEFSTSQNLNHSGNIDSHVSFGISKEDAAKKLDEMQRKLKNGKKVKKTT